MLTPHETSSILQSQEARRMSHKPVSRRTVAIALAGSAIGAKLAISHGDAPAHGTPEATGDAFVSLEKALVAPIEKGARFLDWEVEAVDPLELGAVRVRFRDESGVAFGVEIMARDSSPLAPRPPAQTDRFALYVVNGGDGRMPTQEEQGIVAMALEQLVRRNEENVCADGFLTHAERIAEHRVALLEHVDGTELPGLGPKEEELVRKGVPVETAAVAYRSSGIFSSRA